MKKVLFLLAMFGGLAALSTAEAAYVRVSPGYSGYYYADDDCDDCYDYGYWNDGVVWAGPGWYYGSWFNDEPAFWGWRRNHYWRGHGLGWRGGHGWHGGRGWRGGRGWHGGHGGHGGRGWRGGHGGGHRGGGRGHHGGGGHRGGGGRHR